MEGETTHRPRDHDFEWDEDKARANLRRHGIPFTVAASVFFDPNAICGLDGRED